MGDRMLIPGVVLLAGLLAGGELSVEAQLVPDSTLGNEASTLNGNGSVQGNSALLIEGGALRGANLFHSFQQFNVAAGEQVYFANPIGINHIISRVTGGDRSLILGRLGVNGNASLFLLNPAGILFGRDAQLDLRGAFVASTASALQFGSQGHFSAEQPQSPPLLTVNPSALVFNQVNSGRIENQSALAAGLAFPGGISLFGLQVAEQQSFLLVGGEIVFNGGGVYGQPGTTDQGTRVQLAAIAGPGVVGLSGDGGNWSVQVPDAVARADIQLLNGSQISTISTNGGEVRLWGNNVLLRGGSRIITSDLQSIPLDPAMEPGDPGSGSGGQVSIHATGLVELSGAARSRFVRSSILAQSTGLGRGGDVTITARQLWMQDAATISTRSLSGAGAGGSVTIQASDRVQLLGIPGDFRPTSISTSGGQGQSGDVTITTAQFLAQGNTRIETFTSGDGAGGNLTITARDSVQLLGSQPFEVPNLPLFAQIRAFAFLVTSTSGNGNAGNITINTDRLLVQDRAYIDARSSGLGAAGNITINATDSVQLINRDSSIRVEPEAINSQLTARITTETSSEGGGGDLTINTRHLLLQNGPTITTTTSGVAAGGNLTINATESVTVIGNIPALSLELPPAITSEIGTGTDWQGAAGNLTIATQRLLVQDGGQIRTDSTNQFGEAGAAGQLTVIARESVVLRGSNPAGTPSTLSARTQGSGQGGDINLSTGQLQLQDRAIISTETLTTGRAGTLNLQATNLELSGAAQIRTSTAGSQDAGNIRLMVRDRLLLTGADTGLFANTAVGSTGNGGNILISAPRVEGLNRAKIAVDSQGAGQAGDLRIEASRLTLDNQAQLLAETSSSQGGSIFLQLREALVLRRNSRISTTAGTALAGGDGGNITIRSPLVIALPRENSDITANAFNGRGGQVQITAQGIFGMVFRSRTDLERLLGQASLDPALLPTNDITAISQANPTLNGAVTLNLPETSPSAGTIDVSQGLIDANQLINQSFCRAAGGSEFTVTGRGGLPESPSDSLNNPALWEDWRLEPESVRAAEPGAVVNVSSEASPRLVQAQGWFKTAAGQVVLTSEAIGAVPEVGWTAVQNCQPGS